MAGQLAVADDHRVGGTDRGGAWRQRIEQRDDRFLVGERDVDAGEAEQAHAVEHGAQLGLISSRDIDQAVMRAHADRRGRRFVHGGRGRAHDRGTDQTEQKRLRRRWRAAFWYCGTRRRVSTAICAAPAR